MGVGGSGSLIAGGSSLFFLFRSRSLFSGGFIVSDIRGVDKGVILGVEAKNDSKCFGFGRGFRQTG